MVIKYQNQNYSQLKRDAQRAGQLFTDPEFPATNASLFLSGTSDKDIVWMRPKDICVDGPAPKLVVDGLSSNDLNQGTLGNCWFVAACSALALNKKLWEKVVPDLREQELDDDHPESYAGIFHFHFYRLGDWVDVVIDDRLPTINGELIYMKSKSKNEFWSALLEKAYAKLAGSYEALAGGQTGDALVDFTGGVNETVDIREGGYRDDEEKQLELFKKLMQGHDHHKALISCSIALSQGDSPEAVLECGLIKGHAYTVTDIRQINIASGLLSFFKKELIYMVKIRNPWGQKEWNGPWSDESEEWKRVPQQERNKIGLKVDDDGEFWMELHDWAKWFTDVSICRQVNTSLLSLSKTWHEKSFHGEWKGRSAGGCINHKDTFLHNPQYTFTVPKPDTEIMVSLLQKDVRDQRGLKATPAETARKEEVTVVGENLPIGFYIMKVEENRMTRCHAIQDKAASVVYTNRRSVFGRFTLGPGRYVLLPTTFDPAQERKYFLRIFSERTPHIEMLTLEEPKRSGLAFLCCCCFPKPSAVVTVHLDSAQGLAKQDIVGAGADPYCIVKVGRQKAVTPVIKDTLDPNFNSKVMFFVSNSNRAEVTVEVWNHNVVVDRFMGKRSIAVPRQGESERTTGRLMGRGSHSNIEQTGTITFQVECSGDLRST